MNSSHGELVTVAFFHFCDEFTVWRFHPVTNSLWWVMSTLLYSTLAVGVPCPSVAVVCWWRTSRANQFWDDFFVIILCHILRLKPEMHQIRFRMGLRPNPAGEAYICSVPPDHLDLSGSTSKGREGKERERRERDVGKGGGAQGRKECNGRGWTDPQSLKRGCANANNAWMNV